MFWKYWHFKAVDLFIDYSETTIMKLPFLFFKNNIYTHSFLCIRLFDDLNSIFLFSFVLILFYFYYFVFQINIDIFKLIHLSNGKSNNEAIYLCLYQMKHMLNIQHREYDPKYIFPIDLKNFIVLIFKMTRFKFFISLIFNKIF